MVGYPEDFSFEYRWQMGSVPPPYYYEYSIRVDSNGTGTIELYPDYPVHHPEVRTATINLDRNTLESLYDEMSKAGLFEKECQVVDATWIGGSHSSLSVRAWDKDYKVPFSISGADARRVEPVFLAIQELMPSRLLSGLPG